MVRIVRGANAPLIEKYIREQIQLEKDGLPHVPLQLEGLNKDGQKGGSLSRQSTDKKISESDGNGLQKTLAIVKPDAMSPSSVEQILEIIKKNRFEIVQKRKIWMSKEIVSEFYNEHQGQPFFPALLSYLSSAPVLALILAKENCITDWRSHMGPPNSKRAREDAPRSIRALLGTDARLNAVFGSDSEAAAEREIELLFGQESKVFVMPAETSTSTSGPQKTLAILKPDLLEAGKVDEIIEKILCKGYQVSAREELLLPKELVTELYSNLSEHEAYNDIVTFMTCGPALCLVIKGEDVVNGWAEMVGPMDPEEAKVKSPSR